MSTNNSTLEPFDDVYQEAALNLHYKRITAITAIKLERAMALLQLGPGHLVKCGLVSRDLPTQDLHRSGEEQDQQQCPLMVGTSDVEGRCPSQDSDQNGTDEEHHDTQDDQDYGWNVYEDDYDSDSDIDDHEDQNDEIEGRRNGPIYAFLIYGGVQLRPDEYVLLFRALGVSPQYIEQLQCSTNETGQKAQKAPPHSPHAHSQQPGCADHLGGGIVGQKASPSRMPTFYTSHPIGDCHLGSNGRGKVGIRNDDRTSVSESERSIEDPDRTLRRYNTPKSTTRVEPMDVCLHQSLQMPKPIPTGTIQANIDRW